MHNMGTGGHPFSQQRKSEAQRQEDAFMHLHAGAGCRWIYGVVEAFSAFARKVCILNSQK